MDPDLSFLPLLKIYREAFESRDEEHIWYHFWLEVFVHLNEQTRTNQQRLSVAPQRRYVDATRAPVEVTREDPVVSRSQDMEACDFQEIDGDADIGNSSFESGITSGLANSEEWVQHRTPDFSIFQYLFKDNSLTPRAIIENKPLETLPTHQALSMSEEGIRQQDAQAAVRDLRSCRSQVYDQLTHFFADFRVQEIALFVIIGGRYDMYDVTRVNFEAVLADSKTEMVFVFNDYHQPTSLNPKLVEIWKRLSIPEH